MKAPIWIADDDLDDVYFYCTALEQLEMTTVRHFGSGQELLQQLDSDPAVLPGLLILDGHMPPMGGVEILRRIQADGRFSHVPVVIITGTLSPAESLAARQLGIPVYQKPATQAALFQLLQHILSSLPALMLGWLSISN